MHQVGILEYIGYVVSGAFITAGLAFVAVKAFAHKEETHTTASGGWQT